VKVLIIDNIDSFTYNLKHYLNHFCNNVDVIRFNHVKVNDIIKYDKILFSPGPGLPNEYKVLNDILSRYAASKSILGVCLGHQAIAEFYGCFLENITTPLHGVYTYVKHLNNCNLFDDLPQNFKIGHYHSWVISKKYIPDVLEITSFNESGLIMSIKHKKHDIRSVQFHPESILTDYGLKIIENWIFR